MGILESAKALIEYKADTSDLKAKIKELQGEEKKLAQEQLKAAEERNKGLDTWVERLGNANQALELVGKAVEFGKDAFKEYAEDLRLRTAAGTADIERLKEASLGLRSEDELLAFAAKTQHGAFKLTQEQMELAQKAMVGLTRAGFDQADVTEKVTEALVTGKTRGLREFGIQVKATGDETESLNAIMGELAEKATGVDAGSRTAAEGVQAAGVTMGDAINNMKQSIGAMVAAMAPLIQVLAEAAEGWAQLGSAIVEAPDIAGAIALWRKAHGLKDNNDFGGAAAAAAGPRKPINAIDYWGDVATFDNGKSVDAGAMSSFIAKYGFKQPSKSSSGPLGHDFEDLKLAISGGMYDALETFNKGIASGAGKVGEGVAGGQAIIAAEHQQQIDESVAYYRGQQLTKLAQAAAAKKRESSFLESTFGKIDDFNAYAQAFNMLTGSVSAGLNAWIDGSESAGTAIKKFIGNALKALASQMAIESLKHDAYALGSLAFGDVSGAAAHGAAAAAFGAGAAAAAVAAKELGGGGSTPKGAGASGSASASSGGGKSESHGSGSSSGSGNKSSGRDVVVIYTDSFSEGSPRMREANARRTVGKVLGGPGVSYD